MAGISIRRLGTLVVAAAFALVATGCTAFVDFTGTKEVTGDGSEGPFVVLIECEEATPSEEELEFDGEGTEESGTFILEPFEPGTLTCTITETEQAGAVNVVYECGEVVISEPEPTSLPAGGPGMSLARGIEPQAECIEEDDGLRVEILLGTVDALEISVSFTVINEFATPTPTPTTVPAPAAPAAEAGEVTFTG